MPSHDACRPPRPRLAIMTNTPNNEKVSHLAVEKHAVIAQTSVAPCGEWSLLDCCGLLFTEINLVRSQSIALPSEPCADLAAHLPFSDVGDPRPAGKKPAATPLGKPIVGQISRKCYPVDRGEHDSGAQTLRHLRS
jgi:hypothetical protein